MKKVSMIIIMLVLMSALVFARPTPDTPPSELPVLKDSDFVLDGDFGEKDNFWTRTGDFISNLFNREELSFVSSSPDVTDTSLYADYYYDGGLKPANTLGAYACHNCNIGDYCNIVGFDDNFDSYNLFGDLWYKAFNGDDLDLGDPQWWTSSVEIYYGYVCYDKFEVPEYTYSCRDGLVYLDGTLRYRCSTSELACKVSEKTYDYTLGDSTIDATFCKPLDLCYRCVGTELEAQYQDGCESGWSTTPSSCSIPQVTCYQCSGEDVVTRTFDYSCGTGWSETRPTCETPQITCYQCIDGQVATQTFDGTLCPSGWGRTEPTICEATCYYCDDGNVVSARYAGGCPSGTSSVRPASCDVPLVSCYQCQDGENGVVLSELLETCSGDWTSKELTRNDCSEGGCDMFCKIGEFYDEYPVQFWIIVLAIAGIVVAIVTSSKPPKKPEGVVRL